MVIHVKRAGYLPPWGWQLCRVMGGSFRVKWVAALPCNQWQLCCEIRKNGRGVAFVQCIDTGAQGEHRFVRRYWGPWDRTQPDESIRAILDNGPKWPDLPAPPDPPLEELKWNNPGRFELGG